MTYTKLRQAFLFEAVVGVITLIGVLLLDQAGIALSALLFVRPWILGRGQGDPGEEIRQLYKDAFWISIGITAAALLLTYAAFELDIIGSDRHLLLLLLLILPLFMVSHGLAGYVITTVRSGE